MIKCKPKPCANEDCGEMFVPKYKTTERTCCYDCEKIFQSQKPKKDKKHYVIPRTSKKRAKDERVYSGKRITFLIENPECVIKGSECTFKATTIEHSMKRKGYANEEKRAKGMNLYLDVDFWLPACLNCNLELENNPELSRKHQLSNIHGGKKT